MDEIYFKVKEKYDEAEQGGFQEEVERVNDNDNDDETFGWSLAEQWIPIGIVFQYLQSIYYLIDVNDEQNIYDSKGIQVGKLQLSMSIKLFDTDKKTPLNLIDYEDMEEILSKWIQINVQIKKAHINNEKFTYKTKCNYIWIDKRPEETEIVENQKQPQFNFTKDHMVQIDSYIIQRFLSHQLIV